MRDSKTFLFAGQAIQECVIVVPGFFGQAERQAMLMAARLANLKVLQLINDYTAVALNYAVFQRKNINETAQYYIFYDMGAYKTTASVVSYQLVKDKLTRETLPVVQVIGVGFDRTLGGMEMQMRLRDYLADAFNAMKKTTQNVYESPRALAKLFKEAGRVKNVLSANTEFYAQIEGLLDEQDFKYLVKREKFEELCKDLFDRVAAPLEKAIQSAGLSLDIVKQVILFGGTTRTPKVQAILKERLNQELGKNLNSDEAATMGAAYRGADLATGFKVKKFVIKDAVLFPIQVVFEKEGESGNKRPVLRTLFGHMNMYPQKKVITFNKHKEDFDFVVNYADLEFLSELERKQLGSLNLTKINLKEVGKKIKELVTENVESKGIKAHFALDDSGVFGLVNAELVLEKQNTETKEEEGTLSKLGSTISKLFSGDKDDNKVETDTTAEEKKEGETNTTSTEAPPTNGTTNSTESETGKNETKPEKPKIVTVKETIPSEITHLYTKSLDDVKFQNSVKKIEAFMELDRQKHRRETALNTLESHVIEAQMRFDMEEYSECATSNEIEEIKKQCTEISDWLYEDGMDSEVEVFEKKLEDLRKLTNEVYARHWEHNERPEALKALHSIINGSQQFLGNARNMTKETNPEKDVFTEKEVENLDKAIQETIAWREKEIEAQKKLAKNEPVRLTVKAITEKMAYLDREVKYLVNKIKAWRPKTPPKEKKAKKNDTETVAEEKEVKKNEDTKEPTKESTETPPENVQEKPEEEKPLELEGTVEEEQKIEPDATDKTTETDQHTEL